MKNTFERKEKLALLAVLTTAALAHAYNMFHFPYYENDEGAYMAQAWSLIKEGKLAPYTYWYDHAPAGWILIALWTIVTGGFFTFGFSVNSGRVLMLILHILSAAFLYIATKQLTNSKYAGLLSVLIFSLTPLGIYFQRRVLLDNIMTFWLLLSLVLIMRNNYKLRYSIISAVTFGISILTKENAIFFIPVFLYIIFLAAHRKHKMFAMAMWLSIVLIVTSVYFLYAFLKNELFPTGTWLGGTEEHVSLLGTFAHQLSREGGGILDLEKSTFWSNVRNWMRDDPVIIVAGALTTLANLLIGIRNKVSRLAGLLAASMWAFLMRGGLVIEFYVVPLIPLLALNIAVAVWYLQKRLERIAAGNIAAYLRPSLMVVTALIFTLTALHHASKIRGDLNLYAADQTTPQIEAVEWMLARDDPQAFYVIDNYGYVDLHERGEGKNFEHAEWYWKVDLDPELASELLNGSPENIHMIALTPQMENDITTVGLDITLAAWHNSDPVAIFWNDDWGVEFWATRGFERILSSAWKSYKQHFIISGRVIDPYRQGESTSEGQSYALLRAVWMDDKETFDQVLKWTTDNLQQPQGLFSWKWNDIGGRITVDQGTAADADQDIALALLFAHKKWGDQTYLSEAQRIIAAIWDQEVVQAGNKYYLSAGNWANQSNEIIINPSYLSPASYRIFAQADPSRPWNQLVDTSYEVLQMCTTANLDKDDGVLPPEWCAINKSTFTARQPTQNQPHASEYSYNAFRTPWRIALDYQWFQDTRAFDYLTSLSFLEDEYYSAGRLATAYQHDGEVWEEYESVAAYSGNLGYFSVVNPEMAEHIYEKHILAKFYQDPEYAYWEDPQNYYTQNWAWFGTALHTRYLQNL